MQWNNYKAYTFQSAIKPIGAHIRDLDTWQRNMTYLEEQRNEARAVLNEGQTYGQRDREITIDGIKQRRPPREFPTLYHLAA